MVLPWGRSPGVSWDRPRRFGLLGASGGISVGTVPPPLAGPSPQGKGLSTPVSLSCPFSDRLTAFRYVFDVCPSIKIQPNDNSPRKVSSGSTTLAYYSYLADGTRTSAIGSGGSGLVHRGSLTYRTGADGSLSFEGADFGSRHYSNNH